MDYDFYFYTVRGMILCINRKNKYHHGATEYTEIRCFGERSSHSVALVHGISYPQRHGENPTFRRSALSVFFVSPCFKHAVFPAGTALVTMYKTTPRTV
jgi:hypothetical protein